MIKTRTKARFILFVSIIALSGRISAQAEQGGMPGTFQFSSGEAATDQAYEKARRVISADVQDGKFLAGQNWAQVWTRDTSYSVELACALLHPDVSRTTLLGLTQEVEGVGECWYQDKCGHFAGWPNLTDAIVGASGLWSLYLVTGDRELVRPLYERTLRSLRRAERDAYDTNTGLFKGCSSFMESNSAYPARYAMKGELVGRTCALSTCLLYYRGYVIAADAGEILGEDVRQLREKSARLKAAINTHFWLPKQGFYAYFLDENGVLNPRMEGLGEAFAILTGVADGKRARQILRATPTTRWGFPCLWPQFEEWRDYKRDFAHYYHNGMIWPFVEGYWAWAAARMHDVGTFGRELDALVKLSEKNDTFMELYRPEDGKPDGSPRQLWSASGFLSVIYHGLFGMDFLEKGIRFAPVVPEQYQRLELTHVRYRNAELRIVIQGHGTRVRRFELDGKATKANFPGSSDGSHEIAIWMR